MKSQFFKDTQGLDAGISADDRVGVCVLLHRDAYLSAVREAARLGLTSGEYLDRLIWKARREAPAMPLTACTRTRPPADSPQTRLPPAPPAR